MAQSKLIQVRVDDALKREADSLFADLGLDTSTAIRIFLKHAVKRRGMPFDVAQPTPNAETVAAIEEALAGKGLIGPFSDVKGLMASLESDDV